MRWVDGTEVGRNGRCPCGSGLKLKRCCIKLIEPERRDADAQVGAYLGSLDLWPEVPTLDEVRASVGSFNGPDLIQSLSKIGVLTQAEYFRREWAGSREQEILRYFLPPVWFRKVELWRGSERRARVIHRLLVPAAIQLALIEADFSGGGRTVAGNEHDLGQLLLHLNTHLEHDWEAGRSADAERALFASVFRNHYLSNHDELGSNIGRHWALFYEGMAQVGARFPKEAFDFAKGFETAFGFQHGHMVALTLGIQYHYQRLLSRPLTDPKEFLLGEGFFGGLREAARPAAGRAFAYLSRSWEGHVQAMRAEVAKRPGNLLQFLPLYTKPMVEAAQGVFMPLDTLFLEDAISEGAFWALFLNLVEQKCSKEAEQLRSALGRAVEWYAHEFLWDAFPRTESQAAWFDWDGGLQPVDGLPTPDAVVREGDTVFVIEVTASAPPPSASVSGNPDTLDAALRTMWFGRGERKESAKLIQLEGAARGVREGQIAPVGLNLAGIRRVVPVLVTLRGIPQNPVTWHFYRRLMVAGGLPESFAGDVVFLDLPEMEALCLLKQQDQAWVALLDGWRGSPRREQSFTNYLHFDREWPGRSERLIGWMNAAFDTAGRFLFGKKLIPGNPPRLEE